MQVESLPDVRSSKPAIESRAPKRSAHLDLLRFIAITAVVVFHVVQMGPFQNPFVTMITEQGQYGVDLFFVLSGWLIGGLYWHEQARFGNVEAGRFVLRRWIRTIPPYLVALLLAWLAVFISRREPFSLGYLCFAQNYFPVIPYFLVSWSLCIEEHFYVIAPLALMLVARHRIATHALFAALIVLPCVFRHMESSQGLVGSFGYQKTATHLRLEGLAAGFWLAYFYHLSPSVWKRIKNVSRFLMVPSVAFLVAMMFLSPLVMYRYGLAGLAIALSVLLVQTTGKDAGRIVGHPWIQRIALSSYSVYLTHALMIHVAREVMGRIPVLPPMLYYPLSVLLIAAVGAVFYVLVERTSISMRDRLVPRRRDQSSTF